MKTQWKQKQNEQYKKVKKLKQKLKNYKKEIKRQFSATAHWLLWRDCRLFFSEILGFLSNSLKRNSLIGFVPFIMLICLKSLKIYVYKPMNDQIMEIIL